ncbi:hypothetical protein [Nocardia brasiliensis]|uniref:hypothetical protein n=1 Tax=Nocardia brasiliensis TaxID=37326 RepID=UPI0036728B8B
MTDSAGWDRQIMRDLLAGAQVLEEQAPEIGIPERWIAHVRAQGNAGNRWSGWQQLPAGRAEAREQQLARLHAQVDQLFEMTAAATIYRDNLGWIAPLPAERFEEFQRLQWLRVAMVARALNVTSAEVGTRWSNNAQRWTALLEATRSAGPSELFKRWKSYTTAVAVAHARARYQALRMAGLDPAGAPTPPHPNELNQAAETAWRTANSADSVRGAGPSTTADGDRGARIAEAIEAAAPEQSEADVPDADSAAPATTPQIAQPQPEIEP